MSEELSEILEKAEQAIAKRDHSRVRDLCWDLHHADLAELFEDADQDGRTFLTEALGAEKFSEVLAELPDTLVEETLNSFAPEEQREILDSLPDDDRVDILQDVSDSKRRDFLELLDEDKQEDTRTLLRYNEETAGGRMTTHIGKIREHMTVKDAIEHLRGDLRHRPRRPGGDRAGGPGGVRSPSWSDRARPRSQAPRLSAHRRLRPFRSRRVRLGRDEPGRRDQATTRSLTRRRASRS